MLTMEIISTKVKWAVISLDVFPRSLETEVLCVCVRVERKRGNDVVDP